MKENLINVIKIGTWMTFGVGCGVVIGAAFGKPGLGVVFGAVAGIVIGATMSILSENYSDEEDPSSK